jgi:hypothetical protein
MPEKDSFLEHDFHDSYLIDMEKRDNHLTLVFDTDIYWFPGKPFTLLTLVNPDETVRAKELVGSGKISLSVQEAAVERSGGEKNFRLKVDFHGDAELEINCYNFWTERKEEYRDHTPTSFR